MKLYLKKELNFNDRPKSETLEKEVVNFSFSLMEQCLYFNILKPGNFYESELNTFELLSPSYIVKCENGQWVKFNSDAIKYYFFTIEELRENKLIELGI